MSWVLDSEVLAVLAAIVVVSSVFAGVQLLAGDRVVEPFSELGLLGPEGRIGGYPRSVPAGVPFRLNVYVGNREGRSMYYRVLVKVGTREKAPNATAPLDAEPVAEVRAVLVHGSSKTVPVELAIAEPAANTRLVFELWAYDEEAGGFRYRGLWNQLWINVTPLEVPAPPPGPAAGLPAEVEEALARAYLALRRAERAGGNTTTMVKLLDEAVGLALSGRWSEALGLAEAVVAMEPEVARAGEEARRARLYATVGVLAAAAVTGALGYWELRRRVWLWWARLNSDRAVVWTGPSGDLRPVELAVRRALNNGSLTLGELLARLRGYPRHEVARAVHGLVARGFARLVDPRPPVSFGSYLASRYGTGLAAASSLVALCYLSVYLSEGSPVLAALRIVVGSLFVLFLPGYSLVEALYPGEGELSPLERLALSIGLSLALVPLVGLVLNYTPWGIRLGPVMASLSTLSLGLLLVAHYRKYGLLRMASAEPKSRT